MVIHQKLVRDRIPEIITAAGKTPHVRAISGDDLEQALIEKLGEEFEELRDADSDERHEELADVFEVVRGLAHHLGITMQALTHIADGKRVERGGFDDGVWLESVEDQ